MKSEKIQIGGCVFNADTMKAATWTESDDISATTYRCSDDYDPSITAVSSDEYPQWRGLDSEIADIDGEKHDISICLDELEEYSIYIDGVDHYRADIVDDDGNEIDYLAVSELLSYLGLEIDGDFPLDYDEAVAKFLSDHAGSRYIMHNHRGFANEWTLYSCSDDTEAEAMKAATDNYTEYDSESARPWIRDAMMSKADYKGEYGLAKRCSLQYAADYED